MEFTIDGWKSKVLVIVAVYGLVAVGRDLVWLFS